MIGVDSNRAQGQVATEIARQAARLFATRGYDATPVRAIAEAAGVTCPTLYYHFGNKEGLARALLQEPLSRLVRNIEELLAQPIDPVDRLVAMVASQLAYSVEDPDRARFLYAVMFGPLGQDLVLEVDARLRRIHEHLASAVEQLAVAGLIAPASVSDLVLALRGQVIVRSIDYLYRGGELSPGLSRRLVTRILRGFTPGVIDPGQTP